MAENEKKEPQKGLTTKKTTVKEILAAIDALTPNETDELLDVLSEEYLEDGEPADETSDGTEMSGNKENGAVKKKGAPSNGDKEMKSAYKKSADGAKTGDQSALANDAVSKAEQISALEARIAALEEALRVAGEEPLGLQTEGQVGRFKGESRETGSKPWNKNK
ncbi:MAG: hypothetical protein LBT55_01700 [Clostridiaceae bacterium]|nr:hypothetical protein [Clostridiaceae bacterium]